MPAAKWKLFCLSENLFHSPSFLYNALPAPAPVDRDFQIDCCSGLNSVCHKGKRS